MGRGYSKVLTVMLIIIIVAVIGLLAYLGYDYYSKYRINKAAQEYVDASIDAPTVDVPVGDGKVGNLSTDNTENSITTNNDNNTSTQATSNTTNTKVATRKRGTYKGFYTVGSIDIPKTNCKYPIIEKVTKKSLENAVAVVWPEDPELNKPGNVVIVGHNYRNGLFFSNNKKLSKGDKIYITDVENNRVTYTIYKIFETSDTDTTFYNRDTNGKKEITLSTCTDNSEKRLIIQARE